ncbi:MAG: DUF169 domain-containing protein [Desulfobacteraceae bacterium]|nr:DUF169 domain-containing protein [Desulfobacteraceae bacterium]
MKIDLPPVGIKVLHDDAGLSDVRLFQGVSYCQAVFEATFGAELLVRQESIQVCQWAPAVLGFKTPQNSFEENLRPRFPAGIKALYIAPLALFRPELIPDVVLIRTSPERFQDMVDTLGWDGFIDPTPYRQDITALNAFRKRPLRGFSAWAIKNVNTWLHMLNRFRKWHHFTTLVFRSTWATRIFDRFITAYMANMSMCRNSLVIPFQNGLANISYFCTGGIAWGKNRPDNMTAGFPWEIYRRLESILDYPDKTDPGTLPAGLKTTKAKRIARKEDGESRST